MIARLMGLPERSRLSVLAPVVRGQKGDFAELLKDLRRDGFTRVAIDGALCDLADDISLSAEDTHTIEVYVDRLVFKPDSRSRLADSLELALRLTGGLSRFRRRMEQTMARTYSFQSACIVCRVTSSIRSRRPECSRFNSPHGACEKCSGLGMLVEFEETRIVPDPTLSLREGAIEPWAKRNQAYYQQLLERLAEIHDFSMVDPYQRLPKTIRCMLMHGTGDREFDFFFERGGKQRSYKAHL